MSLNKLNLAPDQAGYAVTDGVEVASTQLDGGAGRYRKDIVSASALVQVQWRINPIEFRYLKSFYNLLTSKGSDAFIIDLYLDSEELTTHECHFVPGSFRLVGQQGKQFTVSARLEAKPVKLTAAEEEAENIWASLFGELGASFETLFPPIEADVDQIVTFDIAENLATGLTPAMVGLVAWWQSLGTPPPFEDVDPYTYFEKQQLGAGTKPVDMPCLESLAPYTIAVTGLTGGDTVIALGNSTSVLTPSAGSLGVGIGTLMGFTVNDVVYPCTEHIGVTIHSTGALANHGILSTDTVRALRDDSTPRDVILGFSGDPTTAKLAPLIPFGSGFLGYIRFTTVFKIGAGDYVMFLCTWEDDLSEKYTTYWTSTNGVDWVAPNLGFITHSGNTNNNILMEGDHAISALDHDASNWLLMLEHRGVDAKHFFLQAKDMLTEPVGQTEPTGVALEEKKSIVKLSDGRYLTMGITGQGSADRSARITTSDTTNLSGNWTIQTDPPEFTAVDRNNQYYHVSVTDVGGTIYALASHYDEDTEIYTKVALHKSEDDGVTWPLVTDTYMRPGGPGQYNDNGQLCGRIVEESGHWALYHFAAEETHGDVARGAFGLNENIIVNIPAAYPKIGSGTFNGTSDWVACGTAVGHTFHQNGIIDVEFDMYIADTTSQRILGISVSSSQNGWAVDITSNGIRLFGADGAGYFLLPAPNTDISAGWNHVHFWSADGVTLNSQIDSNATKSEAFARTPDNTNPAFTELALGKPRAENSFFDGQLKNVVINGGASYAFNDRDGFVVVNTLGVNGVLNSSDKDAFWANAVLDTSADYVDALGRPLTNPGGHLHNGAISKRQGTTPAVLRELDVAGDVYTYGSTVGDDSIWTGALYAPFAGNDFPDGKGDRVFITRADPSVLSVYLDLYIDPLPPAGSRILGNRAAGGASDGEFYIERGATHYVLHGTLASGGRALDIGTIAEFEGQRITLLVTHDGTTLHIERDGIEVYDDEWIGEFDANAVVAVFADLAGGPCPAGRLNYAEVNGVELSPTTLGNGLVDQFGTVHLNEGPDSGGTGDMTALNYFVQSGPNANALTAAGAETSAIDSIFPSVNPADWSGGLVLGYTNALYADASTYGFARVSDADYLAHVPGVGGTWLQWDQVLGKCVVLEELLYPQSTAASWSPSQVINQIRWAQKYTSDCGQPPA